MTVEPSPNPMEVKEPSVSLPFPTTGWGRLWYALFITLSPIFCFWATDLLKPEWQNGQLGSYIILLLFPEASLLFFPLLTYSVICYLLLLFRPTRFAQAFVVRAGIYTGVLLALHYSIVELVYAFDSNTYIVALIWIAPLVISPLYRWAVSKWTVVTVNNVLIPLIFGVSVIGTLVTRGFIPAILLVVVTMAAPFWSFLIALRAAIWLYKNYETKLTLLRGLGLTAWLGGYAAAWRYDILKMYELYAALPPQPPPDCYIATAAAHGHLSFVRAWTVWREDGKLMQVNRQLQLLKCAELALLAICPRWHKRLRRAYDGIGGLVARKIQDPFLADLAYLCLKPFELLARIILKRIIPEIDSISSKMYTK